MIAVLHVRVGCLVFRMRRTCFVNSIRNISVSFKFQIAFENNISRKYSYIAFAILHVALVGTSTFLFLPADRFEPNLVKTKENAEPLNGKDKEEKEQFLNKTNESKKSE